MIDIILDVLDKETDDIRKTLGSICYQLNMPEVYVHLEGNVPETIINHYKQFINIDNKIENLKGTHLMYINAGDVLANPYVLDKLYRYSHYDVVVAAGGDENSVVQVCYELTDDNQEREFDGLASAARRFGLKSGVVVTCCQSDLAIHDGCEISVVPAAEYLTSTERESPSE